jgi:hypothetical protein
MGLTRRTRGSRVILPIRPDVPGPVLELNRYYVLNGLPVHVLGQRWKQEDAGHCPYPTSPDPHNPGHVLCCQLLDGITGEVIPDVSCEAYRRAVAARLGIPASSARGSRAAAIRLRRG